MPDSGADNADEIQRRLRILRQELEAGRVRFAPHLAESVRSSLKAVRVGPEGQVDLATVDARVRAMALAITAMRDREELKSSIPLIDIQADYFRWLDANFGTLFEIMRDRGLQPAAVAHGAASNAEVRESIVRGFPDFIDVTREFWQNAADAAYAHLEDGQQLKAVFGGDLFPAAQSNIASKCGIYVDTIVVPDPFLRIAGILHLWSPEKQTRYIVKHALNVLNYRELALAEVDPPIIVVLPDRQFLDNDEQEFLSRVAEPDIIAHVNSLFDSVFTQIEDVHQFANELPDIETVVRRLVRPDRLLFDVAWPGSAADHLRRALRLFPQRDFDRLTPIRSQIGLDEPIEPVDQPAIQSHSYVDLRHAG